jgi:signal transduction histidine kinase
MEDSIIFLRKVAAQTEICCECVMKNLTGPDGKYYYLLQTEISLAPLKADIRTVQTNLTILFLAVLFAAFFLARWLSGRLVSRLEVVNEGVRHVVASGDLTFRIDAKGKDEIANLGRNFDQMISKLEKTQHGAIEVERAKSLAKLARQVAHDIRSPLAALKMAAHELSKLPENERILLRSAIIRISDIANNLLNRNKVEGNLDYSYGPERSEAPVPILVASVLDSLVIEKQAKVRSNPRIVIDLKIAAGTYGDFVLAKVSEFKRAISNLVDNALDAISQNGHVELELSSTNETVLITIRDNGKGIPEHLIPNILHEGRTYGKLHGNGLGLSQANSMVTEAGGKIGIRSRWGIGTEIEVQLPKAQTPLWFTSTLKISTGTKIVILDDDESIHQVWKKRFEEIGVAENYIEIFHCFNLTQAVSLVRKHRLDNVSTGDMLYLIDYELTGETTNGLSLIHSFDLQKCSYLVTSRYEDIEILAECMKSGIKILPKSVAAHIPIEVIKIPIKVVT